MSALLWTGTIIGATCGLGHGAYVDRRNCAGRNGSRAGAPQVEDALAALGGRGMPVRRQRGAIPSGLPGGEITTAGVRGVLLPGSDGRSRTPPRGRGSRPRESVGRCEATTRVRRLRFRRSLATLGRWKDADDELPFVEPVLMRPSAVSRVWPLRVIRYRGDPAASPAMSAVTPKADQVPHAAKRR